MLRGISLAVLLYLREGFSQHFSNRLKREFSVYFDFLSYFKYTWIFEKFNYNLFNFIVTIQGLS